jgi:hypothetical protein
MAYHEWHTVVDGKIGDVMQSAENLSPGDEWIEHPVDWAGSPGDKLEWFDSTMHRIPDFKLIEQGLRKDNRGRWYDKNKIGETKIIYNLDEEPESDFTRKQPLENEPFQKWDASSDSFVVDTVKKERAEKEMDIGRLRAEINTRDWKWLKAQKLDVDVDEIYPGERAWYTETVAKINELEEELALEGTAA